MPDPSALSRASEGYRPPICGGCGHPVGDHQSAGTGWPHPQRYGLCHYTGCDCEQFISDNPDSDGRNFDRLQDARATNQGEIPDDFDFTPSTRSDVRRAA